ncbi:unnamed protein product [Rotaria socialis]|uniref:Uncharacterized protein n=1 Tax=Rotaria socialis TaxID=392032 RepID=A0A818BHD2_9BILA|nr:unnamed protein product [Rotaria socialis]CAF4851810.1 unnamed protein product [Rotaria socialis]
MSAETITTADINSKELSSQLRTTTTTTTAAINHQRQWEQKMRTPALSIDFSIREVEGMYFNTIVFILLLITASLPMAKLIVGIRYLNQCPCQPNLNVWLIVSGVRGLIIVFVWSLLVRNTG